VKRLARVFAVALVCVMGFGCEDPPKPIPVGSCAAEQECAASEGTCLSPGQFAGCGICRRPLPSELCTNDAACAAMGKNAICTNSPSLCLCGGETVCTFGCGADSECGEGQRCGGTHRCEAKTCATAADCPTDFRCDAGSCKRKGCGKSSDCSGYCVNGSCFSTPGTCQLPRP